MIGVIKGMTKNLFKPDVWNLTYDQATGLIGGPANKVKEMTRLWE